MRSRSIVVLTLLLSLSGVRVLADSSLTPVAEPTREQRLELLGGTDAQALAILRFWFEEWDEDIETGGKGRYNDKWFPHGSLGAEGSKEVDWLIRDEFLTTFEEVVSGKHGWSVEENAYENLAYILLIDQFARNMFRGTERAYEHDAMARAAALTNMDKGMYLYYFTGYQKLFVVYPLMHYEDSRSQERSMRYLKAVNEHPSHRYEFLNAMQKGVEHYQVIFMFGRFPHRNVRQDRTNTEIESAYLEKKGTKGFVDGSKW